MADIRDLLRESGYSDEEIANQVGTGGGAENYTFDSDELQNYKDYGDAEFTSAGLGALNSLTFGTSNFVMSKLGLVDRDTLAAIRKYNPKSYALGEIGTDIATIIATGGFAGLAKGGTKVAAKVASKELVKEGGEQIAKKGIGKLAKYFPTAMIDNMSTKAAQNTFKWADDVVLKGRFKGAQKVGQFALAGGLDNTAMGIRDAVTDTALSDRKESIGTFAERVMTYAPRSFALGAGFGGALGGLTTLAKPANLLVKQVGKKIDDVKGLGKKALDGTDMTFDDVMDKVFGRKGVDDITGSPDMIKANMKQRGVDAKVVKNVLKQKSDEIGPDALMQIVNDKDKLAKLLDNAVNDSNAIKIKKFKEVEELDGPLGDNLDLINKGIIDDVITPLELKYANVVDIKEKRILNNLRKTISADLPLPGTKTVDIKNTSLEYLQKEKSKFGEKVGDWDNPGNKLDNEFNRGMVEYYNKKIEQALQRSSIPDALGIYKTFNETSSSIIDLKGKIKDKALLDKTTGKAIWEKLLNTGLWAVVRKMGLGFTGPIIGKGVNSVSDAISSVFKKEPGIGVKYREAILETLDDSQKAVETLHDETVSQFFTNSSKTLKSVSSRGSKSFLSTVGDGTKAENYETFRDQLVEAIDDPERLATDVAEQTQVVSTVFPELGNEIASRNTQTMVFLYQRLIKETPSGNILESNHFIPNDEQLSKFEKYTTALEPSRIYQAYADNLISREHVEVLDELYPQIKKDLINSTLENIAKGKKLKSYNQKLAFSTLLGLPYETTMQPRKVANFQMTFAEQHQIGQQTHGGERPHNYQLSGEKQSQTKTQALENK